MSDISICSNALLLLGANPIDSFNDGTVESEAASNFYPVIYGSTLSERRWTFNTVEGQISKLTATPNNDWDFQYQLPSDLLTLHKTWPTTLEYDLYKNKLLYTDYDGEIWIDYQFKPNEVSLPDYFRDYLELRLAERFCIPVTEDKAKLQMIQGMVKEARIISRNTDAKQRKNIGIKDSPLIDVRG